MRPTETHKFDVNITRCPGQSNTAFSNCSSSIWEVTWLFMCSAIESSIGICKDFSMCRLWSEASWLVENKCMEPLKEDNSSLERKDFVLDMRSFQSSIVVVAFLMLVRRFLKVTCDGSFPCWWKIVESVTTVLKLRQSAVPWEEPTYNGMSITGGNWARSPTRIIEQPPKCFYGEGMLHREVH